eukprot:c13122_g6_i3.p1 GENE.c13122_g6_i3~~c13122_g6_i3.p1  ORF type:complete len:128 (-),score=34.59 c13122_g6_i3:289-672(-)
MFCLRSACLRKIRSRMVSPLAIALPRLCLLRPLLLLLLLRSKSLQFVSQSKTKKQTQNANTQIHKNTQKHAIPLFRVQLQQIELQSRVEVLELVQLALQVALRVEVARVGDTGDVVRVAVLVGHLAV